MKRILPQIFYSIIVLFIFQNSYSQVGINTITPLSTLDINGNLSVKVITINGDVSAQNISDGIYISVNPNATDQEFKLPAASNVPGRIYFIRNVSALTAKLTTAGGAIFTRFNDTFTGATEIYMYTNGSSDAMTVLKNSYRNIAIISDGSNWSVFN